MIIELRRNSVKFKCCTHASGKFCHRMGFGIQIGGYAKICLGTFSEVESIHRKGSRNKIAPGIKIR
jgi:hypothetical protein